MINLYFIDYRNDEAMGEFQPIGVWMHNPDDGDEDMFYLDESCPEAEEANWVINRLVEADLKTPPDFLEFHQQQAGYRCMRGPVREIETEIGYDAFGNQAIQAAIEREIHAATD